VMWRAGGRRWRGRATCAVESRGVEKRLLRRRLVRSVRCSVAAGLQQPGCYPPASAGGLPDSLLGTAAAAALSRIHHREAVAAGPQQRGNHGGEAAAEEAVGARLPPRVLLPQKPVGIQAVAKPA